MTPEEIAADTLRRQSEQQTETAALAAAADLIRTRGPELAVLAETRTVIDGEWGRIRRAPLRSLFGSES